jgi:hypothetical protein
MLDHPYPAKDTTAAQFVSDDIITFASPNALRGGKSLQFWASSTVGLLYVSFHNGSRCLEVDVLEPDAVRELVAFLSAALPALDAGKAAFEAKIAAQAEVAK